jgi:Flp pilus assembly protein TadD
MLVGAAAVASAGVVAGVVLATRQDPSQPKAQCASGAQPLLVPGVATTHATEVRNAIAKPAKKAALALEPLAQSNPKDPAVQFNYGVALFCAGFLNEASQAFRVAKTVGRNTFYEMRADEILHPQYFSPQDGLYPLFQPIRSDPLLLQGVLQQRQGHQHSAERLYRQAARARPNDDEARVAAAVGLFDEDNLSASFSRLGPLVRRFPASQSVRYHLGLLLAWTGQRDQAITEFRLARSLGAGTSLGKQAEAFLRGLVSNGTKGQSR